MCLPTVPTFCMLLDLWTYHTFALGSCVLLAAADVFVPWWVLLAVCLLSCTSRGCVWVVWCRVGRYGVALGSADSLLLILLHPRLFCDFLETPLELSCGLVKQLVLVMSLTCCVWVSGGPWRINNHTQYTQYLILVVMTRQSESSACSKNT